MLQCVHSDLKNIVKVSNFEINVNIVQYSYSIIIGTQS